MNNDKKNILIIFCGGTISMSKDIESGSLVATHGAEQFFQLEPRIQDLANITVHFLQNIDSTNINPNDWEAMVDAVKCNYEKYDGFVITHGTNTLSYSASALSFAMQDLGKPVIFTGAQIPAEVVNTDARNNLVNAIRIASMDLAGVFVVFGSKILLGCRSKKLSESDLDAFGTFNESDFGEISIGIKLNREDTKRHSRQPIFKNGFEPNILSITCVPGINIDWLSSLIDQGLKGIILRGYGSGDISVNFDRLLRKAQTAKVPVVVTTQCRGSTVMGLNEPGLCALKLGAIQAFDMSMESMCSKMMWLLRQSVKYEDFKAEFHRNISGEINPKRAKYFVNKELSTLTDYHIEH